MIISVVIFDNFVSTLYAHAEISYVPKIIPLIHVRYENYFKVDLFHSHLYLQYDFPELIFIPKINSKFILYYPYIVSFTTLILHIILKIPEIKINK